MIDWTFIESLEGVVLTGYVPDAGNSQSGVTIASGVDLGQQLVTNLPAALRTQLGPYCGLRGTAATAYLNVHPLTITSAQASVLDACVQASAVAFISRLYDQALRPDAFSALPRAAQTVIASVSFQYGNVKSRCPVFWNACVKQDWVRVVSILEDFGDRYTTRRRREAGYLESHLTA